MKNAIVFVFVFIFGTHSSFSQIGDLLLKSKEKALYLDHKVQAKENFYSIGRLYNVPAKEIAGYNNLEMSEGLSLAQMIHIPLTSVNFSQTVNKGTPVYCKVGEKAALQKISSANNNVPLENLRNWNNISSDHINGGSKLIVGFLISRELPAVAITEKKEPVVNTEKIVKTESLPVIQKNEPGKEENNLSKEPVIKTEKIVKTESLPLIKKNKPKAEVNILQKEPVIEKPTRAAIKTEIKPVTTDQGYFQSAFDQQVKIYPLSKNEMVTSGIFKTASGWQDVKYYLLMDGIQPGMVVKIINPENNKVVYAKVLGEMRSIRLNEGLNIRISNSAASVLQVAEQDKFIVKVNY